MGFSTSSQLRGLSPALQRLMLSPYAWSALLSVGLHGVLFGLLPLLSSSALRSKEPEIRRPVKVVELSPSEQIRLPNLSSTPVELPPLARTPSSSILTPLPNSTFPPSPSRLPPTVPGGFVLQPPIQFPSFVFPSSRLPPPPLQFPSVPPTLLPTPIPSVSPSPSPTSRIIREPSELTPPSPGSSPTPDASPSPSGLSPDQLRQQGMARLNADVEKRRAIIRGTTYSPAGTTTDDANLVFGRWFYEELGKKDPRQELQVVATSVPFPADACRIGETRRASVGVVVNKDGQVDGDPVLLLSSGFPMLNEQAKAIAQQHTYDKGEQDQRAYQLNITFEYSADDCSKPSTPSSPPPT